MNENLTDGELVRKITEEDQELYSELVKRYEGPLFGYLLRLTNYNSHDCEDILQNVFIKVFKNLRAYDQTRKFSSWIYRITHNEAINFIKKHRKEISLEDSQIAEIIPSESNLLEEMHLKQEKERVENAIQKLEVKYREIIILRYTQDKTYEEISDILRKPVNTVGTLINRAKKELKNILNTYEKN